MPGETAPTVAVTSGTSTGASGPSGVAPKPKQESASESAAPTATHTFGLPEINNYASPSFQKAFAGSPEAVALKLGEDCCFGAGFLRLMECKLNTVVWELYAQMTQDQDVSIVVNMRSPAKPEARAQVPAPPNLQLPFVSRVSSTKSKGCIPFCRVFGVAQLLLEKSCFLATRLRLCWAC